MTIVALNCGSSSVKAAAFAIPSLERIYEEKVDVHDTAATSPAEIVQDMLPRLERQLPGAIVGIVHRVVHGGDRFTQPTRIDDAVIAALEALSPLAPLHNPPAIATIAATRARYSGIPNFAVFDTAFHASLPPVAREYALSRELREARGMRRFGFHGISHAHLTQRVAEAMSQSAGDLRIVSCHLGSGASVAAIAGGRSVDTSMGMTPLEGLVMGTRAGDLDPGIVLELMREGRAAAESIIAKQSGLVGLAGTADMRTIEQRAAQGRPECLLALDLFAYRVRKYIGAYAAAMGGVDAIGFTGGIGENSAVVRERCVMNLEFLGIALDRARNASGLGREGCVDISQAGARVRSFILRADEEAAMAGAVLPLLRT